jgi:hypothetical protein
MWFFETKLERQVSVLRRASIVLKALGYSKDAGRIRRIYEDTLFREFIRIAISELKETFNEDAAYYLEEATCELPVDQWVDEMFDILEDEHISFDNTLTKACKFGLKHGVIRYRDAAPASA